MASTYSTNLKIELIGTGEQSNTWGTTTNTNLGTALEQAIVGYGNPKFTSDANLTITLTDSNATQTARNFVLDVTCDGGVSLTTTRELIVPTVQKPYIIRNNTSGGQSITVKTSGGTGVTVPNGKYAFVYADGTNVVSSITHISTLSLTTALVATSGGTGQSSYTTGDILYASSSSALSKLAGVATGSALISGGVGTAPSWGKVGLTTHVSGTLPIANGGTGSTSTAYCSLTTNVTGTLPIANGGTGSTSTTYCNLTTNVTGTLPVANGGTGAATLTANNVLLGNGTSALQVVAPGTSGNVLTSNGTTWASSAPAVSSVNSQTGAVVTTSVDSVGCTMWLICTNTSNLGGVNTTVNGANLRYGYSKSNSDTEPEYVRNTANTYSGGGTALSGSGTWRKMSTGATWVYSSGDTDYWYWYPQLFVRVS